MRTYPKSGVDWLSVAWVSAAVLLVLPGCNQVYGLDPTVPAPELNLEQGGPPRNYAIFCDIESRRSPRRCATQYEKDLANEGLIMPQSRAALALNTRKTGFANVALDYSAPARARCGGEPEVVTYEGPYPDGTPICVNFNQVIGPDEPLPYRNAGDVCRALCQDINRGGSDETIESFCNAAAHASTNYPFDTEEPVPFGFGGYLGACLADGMLRSDFDTAPPTELIDPRRFPEPVAWAPGSLFGVSVSGTYSNSLTRTTPTNGISDAGAASTQVIRHGDGYVEFTAIERDKRRMIGFSFGSATDTDPTFNNVGYAIDLGADGILRIVESGVTKMTYVAYSVTAPETFRISVTANNDADRTATVTYSKIAGSCAVGSVCPEVPIYKHTGAPTVYPFHVDTSFTHQGGTLADVRIVRITRQRGETEQ